MNTGLVFNKTSDPLLNDRIIITDSPLVTRLKKMKRNVITSSRVIQESLTTNRQKFKVAMVTLTYRDDVEWDARHVSSYLHSVRQWAKRRGHQLRYVWVMELTKRGRPHYHVLFWLPKGVSMPMADKRGWWKHGMTNSVWARKPVGYIAKYASKGLAFASADAPQLPRGARICGCGGLDLPMQDSKNWILCPTWLKELLENQQFSVRKKGSFWCVEKTYCYSSPWRFDFIERVLIWRGHQPIHDYDEVFPQGELSDFDFGRPTKFKPSPPKYKEVLKNERIRFSEFVDRIRFNGYYDSIDRAIAVINQRGN